MLSDYDDDNFYYEGTNNGIDSKTLEELLSSERESIVLKI